jgi:chorismate mutase-like protein
MQSRTPTPDEIQDALCSCRDRLDACDARLLECIRERFSIIMEVGEIKREKNIPVMQEGRVNAVVTRARAFAVDHGLSPDAMEEVYRLLIAEACRLEAVAIQMHSGDSDPRSRRDNRGAADVR